MSVETGSRDSLIMLRKVALSSTIMIFTWRVRDLPSSITRLVEFVGIILRVIHLHRGLSIRHEKGSLIRFRNVLVHFLNSLNRGVQVFQIDRSV